MSLFSMLLSGVVSNILKFYWIFENLTLSSLKTAKWLLTIGAFDIN